MQAGGQGASQAADELPVNSAVKGISKVGGAASSHAGAAVEAAANEESKNPQGGGVMSMVKITGRGMKAGGQGASQ